MTGFDPDVIADEVLPLGGPYTPEALAAAAGLLAELVRRLNHATFDPYLDYPSQVDAVVGRLAGAVGGMPQLCDQLADLLARFDALRRTIRREVLRGFADRFAAETSDAAVSDG